MLIATTRMFALHVKKGLSAGRTIADMMDYVRNPEKTRNGELVTGYECSQRVAEMEFVLAHERYSQNTGRGTDGQNVLGYHIRQAFKPGEIDPETANRLGYELAMRFTRGHHSFIVATHIDRHHIHNHIIFNSVDNSCNKKFRDFKQSGKAIRRISDRLCLENGLSIIENPKSSRGHYGKWMGGEREPSLRDQLQAAIDKVLSEKLDSFERFTRLMEQEGYEVKCGKHTSFKSQKCKKFIRLRSLGDDYTEEAIRERIAGKRVVEPKKESARAVQPQPDNLLIQIQRCVKPKGSPGYDRWAAVFNLKQISKTFQFLQDNNLLELSKLAEKAQKAKDDFNRICSRMKAIDSRLPEITDLQRHIGTYGKTKEVYAAYHKSGWSKKYYAAHKEEIDLHKEIKKAFDRLGLEKLPTIKALQSEYAALLSEKNTLRSKYKDSREYMQDILTVQQNARDLLGYSEGKTAIEKER